GVRTTTIDGLAIGLYRLFRLRRRDTGTQTRDTVEIMVVDRDWVVGLKRERQPQTCAVRMPKRLRHDPDDCARCAVDNDRAAKHVGARVQCVSPEIVADDCHVRSCITYLFRAKISTPRHR